MKSINKVFIESTIRGGTSMTWKAYAEAKKNAFLKSYEANKPTSSGV